MTWITDQTPVDETALAALRQRLADRNDAEIDVAYRRVATPIGELLLAATPVGLVRVAFATEDADAVLQSLADRLSPRVLEAPRRLDSAARQLAEYLDGRRQRFELPLDFVLTAGYRQEVLTHLRSIEYGQTESYRQVAEATGRPKAVRAVGTACATNPLPLVVPCHRVLRSDGSFGGYRGGPEIKRLLLSLETTR